MDNDAGLLRRRWPLILLFGVIATLGYLGQLIPSILLQPTKADLRLSDTTIGLINGLGVTVIGALAAFPIGYAADRYGRKNVLVGSILVWSAFLVVVGLARNPTEFALGIMGFNIGDAAMLPLIYAMLATRFHGPARETANAILVAIFLLGASGVYAVGGYMLAFFEEHPVADIASWRQVCFLVALLGPLIAAPLLFLKRAAEDEGVDPQTVGVPSQTSEPESQPTSYIEYVRKNGWLIAAVMIAISVYYTAYGVLLFWAPAILERAFGLASQEANIRMGETLLVATAGAIAVLLLVIPKALKVWGHAASILFVIIGCVVMLLPTIGLFFVETADGFLLMIAVAAFGMSGTMMLVPGLLQACAPDQFRSRTIALFPTMSGLMRIGMPALVGTLSTQFGEGGEALLQIITWLVLGSLCISIAALTFLLKRFVRLAQMNLAEPVRPSTAI
ncbi:MAG: MFS transporter [Pseudomonadota bacterium]